MFARDLPPSMFRRMEGAADVPPEFEFDGCTMALDEIGALDLVFACCVHDHDYSQLRKLFQGMGWCPVGSWEKDDSAELDELEVVRKYADQRFYRNMRRCGASRLIAGMYYRRVRLWGFPLAYEGIPRGVKIWRMVKIFFGRYIPVWVKRTK